MTNRSVATHRTSHGAPEFIIEIAHSSRAIDLHAKKDDYARHGVKEYLVVSVGDQKFFWFDLAAAKVLAPDANGVYRIAVFPGLWIDGPALLAHDYAQLMATLHKGLAVCQLQNCGKTSRRPLD